MARPAPRSATDPPARPLLSDSSPPGADRIERIPTLPVFFKLGGRTVLLGGGAEPAVWKAELLAAAGARVVVCDPAPCPTMVALARRVDALELRWRAWRSEDFVGAALAVGALTGTDAAAFHDAAHRAGVTVNIVDDPGLCDFQFGTIVARPPLLIAISTDGAAPVFGQALRARIEALLPDTIKAWAQAAKDWRPAVQALGLGFAARRRFWAAFADRALDGTGRPPGDEDRAAFAASALEHAAGSKGHLDLVGVGPGPADLITLRAVRALQSADVIVHQHDIAPSLLALGRREANRFVEPAAPGELSALLARLLETGNRVALAGLGDPDRCGRWAIRRSAVKAHTIAYDVVNGLDCTDCPAGCPNIASALNAPA